jgi:hypothetical protein
MKNSIQKFLTSIGVLFSSHAWLSLFTLLVLMGLFMGLSKVSLQISNPKVESVGATTAGSNSRSWDDTDTRRSGLCGQLLLVMRPQATVGQLNAVLQEFDSFVVFGPNENLAYEVHIGSKDRQMARKVFEESAVVADASPNSRCP